LTLAQVLDGVIFGTNNGGAFNRPIFQCNFMGYKNFSERKKHQLGFKLF
jgi:hypothetical protein